MDDKVLNEYDEDVSSHGAEIPRENTHHNFRTVNNNYPFPQSLFTLTQTHAAHALTYNIYYIYNTL